MKGSEKTTLMIHLSRLEDPRTGHNTTHKFIEVVFIAVCAVINGCESWIEMEDYGQSRQQWFRGFLSLKGGIPSHDTFRRLLCILDFESFQRVFIDWTQEVKESLGIEKAEICVDGNTLRRSFNRSKSIQALHMVGAWSASASMNLAQVPTQENSNEMIPGLLDLLDLRGCLVSIDAMSDGH